MALSVAFEGVLPDKFLIDIYKGLTFKLFLGLDKSNISNEVLYEVRLDLYKHENSEDVVLTLSKNNGMAKVSSEIYTYTIELGIAPDSMEVLHSLNQDYLHFILSGKIGTSWYPLATGKASIIHTPLGNI